MALHQLLIRIVRAREFGPAVGLIAVTVFLHVKSHGRFFTADELAGVTAVASIIGLIAVGIVVLMMAGEFDLSVAVTYAGTGIVLGRLVEKYHWNEWPAFAVAMAAALAVGLMNGLITTKLHIPSFITTLGTLFALNGFNYWLTSGFPVSDYSGSAWRSILGGHVTTAFDMPFVWMLIVAVLLWFVMASTQLGNWVRAAGGRAGVARGMGVPEHRVKIIAFCISSLCAGFAGAIQLAASGTMSAGFGGDNNLIAIVAGVVGGTSLFGVTGSIPGAVLGACIVSSLQVGLPLINVSATWYTTLIGVMLIVAVVVNVRLEKVRFLTLARRLGTAR